MDLGKSGWFAKLLREAVEAHVPDSVRSLPPVPANGSSRARARAYARRMLRESGLLYGTPMDASCPSRAEGAPTEEMLFRAILRTCARLALDIAALSDAPPGKRHEQLLVVFAAYAGLIDEAAAIDERLRSRPDSIPRRLWSKVESALAARAPSVSADPAYGLVLHNGALYVDANLFARQAIDYFARGSFSVGFAQRRLQFAAAQKALLVEVLTGLSVVDQPASAPTKRAILHQIDDLGLPTALTHSLRARVKQSFQKTPALGKLVKDVRSRDMRRFIVEQTLLASLVDGHRAPREIAFIRELAVALKIDTPALSMIEMEVAEFYAKNRSVVDVFTLGPGAEMMGEELVGSIQRTVEKNFHRLMREVKQTGELSVLLAKAARGQKLTDEERRKMRVQLIDVAKAIPALAIFAAPGGLLLLIALAKVLPFNILPSAFQDPPEEESALPIARRA